MDFLEGGDGCVNRQGACISAAGDLLTPFFGSDTLSVAGRDVYSCVPGSRILRIERVFTLCPPNGQAWKIARCPDVHT